MRRSLALVLALPLLLCACKVHAARGHAKEAPVPTADDDTSSGDVVVDAGRFEITRAMLDPSAADTTAYGPGWGDFKYPQWYQGR